MTELISRQAVEDLIMETDPFWCEGMTRAIFEGIKRLPTTEPKCAGWIPCKKQMPKPNEVVGDVAKYYLVQTEYGDMMVACYNAEGDERWWEQMYHFKPIEDEIVAWMELPEEYKEGGEDLQTIISNSKDMCRWMKRSEEECEDEDWYTELDDPKIAERSEE